MEYRNQFEPTDEGGPEWLLNRGSQDEGQPAENVAFGNKEAGFENWRPNPTPESPPFDGDSMMAFLASKLSNDGESDNSRGGRRRYDPDLELIKASAAHGAQFDKMISSATGVVSKTIADLESAPERDRIRKAVAKFQNGIHRLNDIANLARIKASDSMSLHQAKEDLLEVQRNVQKDLLEYFEEVATEIFLADQSFTERCQCSERVAKSGLENILGNFNISHPSVPISAAIDVIFEERGGDIFGGIDLSGKF